LRNRLAIVTSALLLACSASAGVDPKDARSEYARMQKWLFSSPKTLTAPVTITRDTATWTFESGSVRLMEPAADGTVTGLVFEGQGRFKMTIPDRFEVAQLRRFTKRPDLQDLDQSFTQLVLRSSDPALAALFGAASGPYATHALATKRHEVWLVETFEDVDASILGALLNGSTQTLVIDMKTADFDWLTYEYDPHAAEEIGITKTDARGSEGWVNLDRPEDRGKDGRPGGSAPRASLDHIDVKADLTKFGRTGTVGLSEQPTMLGKYVVESTITGIADSTTALTLNLSPIAQDVNAFAEDGATLAVFRNHIGKRSVYVDNRYFDDEFMVVLDKPLLKGEKRRIRFQYELETANYALGRSWYPTLPDTLDQKHTARLELTVRRKNELRAMGKMEKRSDTPDSETSVWVIDRPAKMVTFSTNTRFEEVRVSPSGIPPVVSFGPAIHFTNTAKLRNVAADVANSMQYFQQLLGSNVPDQQFYVTSIAAGHGQAFDGFLHMTDWTFEGEHPGASELFRAHEVAHSWWGHKVGWKSYRDQWLSESFAEYCAMMFVRDFVKGGDKHFEEILRSYEGIVKGNLSGGFSKFNRPGLIEFNATHRKRLGPIGHGYRAGTFEIPAGYVIQSYYKGPLVVHMLRMLLGYRTGNDAMFIKTMRDFLREYDGRAASTDDFRRVLERNLGGPDLSWFFNSWIYGAEIPSFTWSYSVKPEGDAFLLTIDVERRDVSDDFQVIVPVQVEFDGGKVGYLYFSSKSAKDSLTRKVASKPKNVIFGPNSSLLANIKRK
jgi:hypothetical protein